ncbi:hypothetical protein L204_105882 [Cryptococcus depauperatus]|nr:nipsnap family protein [Cryptococcus depauperatus CBS 7855]
MISKRLLTRSGIFSAFRSEQRSSALQPALAFLHTSPILQLKRANQTNTVEAFQSQAQEDDPKQGGEGFLGALFYGSKEAKAEGLVDVDPSKQAHSTIVGRGKYVHEKITHAVIPAQRDAYVAAADKFFRKVMERNGQLGGVKLMGSWENIVGDVGTFTHIFEYEGYKGFDESTRLFRTDPEISQLLKDILPHLQSRQHQIVSEFSFWPSSPPHDSGYPDGGVFEMRSYLLQPGKLLDWEFAWRKGLEARKRFVQPVGAFFSQAGQLHEVHHIWQYPDMEARKRTRDQAWSVGSWSDTVRDTVKLAKRMKSSIMVPCSWSPIR